MNVVRVLPLTPVAHATRAFQMHGRVGVTVVVKLAYTLVPDGVMKRLATTQLEAGDLAPFRERADVTFVGSAHAPAGATVPAMAVRLSVLSGERAVLDKRLLVSGDRVADATNPRPAATPFSSMPLVWGRALGGEGFPQNPGGVGIAASASGQVRLPNVAYFDEAFRHRPAGFAPIAPDAPLRRRFLAQGRDDVDTANVPDLSEGVSFSYFQAAPPDQQVPYLSGDETIALEGLSATHPTLRSRLPGEIALARAYLPRATETPIALSLDGLTIDGEAGTCAVTWRGCLSAVDLDMLSELVIGVAVDAPGRPIHWPKPAEIGPIMKLLGRVEDRTVVAGTVELSQTEHDRAGQQPEVPFAKPASRPSPRASAGPIPGAPWAAAHDASTTPARDAFRGTIVLEDLAPLTRRALAAGGLDLVVGMPMSTRAPPSEPPPAARRQPSAPIDPWAKSIEAAPFPEPGPPPDAKPPVKPDVRGALYVRPTRKG